MCVCVYVRACLWIRVYLFLCDRRGSDAGGRGGLKQQSSRHHHAAEGERERQENHRQTNKYDRNKESNEPSAPHWRRSHHHISCRICCKQMRSKWVCGSAGLVPAHSIMKRVYPLLSLKVVTPAVVCPELCLLKPRAKSPQSLSPWLHHLYWLLVLPKQSSEQLWSPTFLQQTQVLLLRWKMDRSRWAPKNSQCAERRLSIWQALKKKRFHISVVQQNYHQTWAFLLLLVGVYCEDCFVTYSDSNTD